MQGTPDIFLISQKTGHGVSPLVRQRLDAFLKEWGDRGQSLARTYPVCDLHHALQPRLLGERGRSRQALRARRHRRPAQRRRREVRNSDAQRLAPGSQRDRARRRHPHRRAGFESQVRRRGSRCKRPAQPGKWASARPRAAQDARAARSHRRCLHRSFSVGAAHRNCVERGRESAGPALPGAIRPPVGQVFPRAIPS